MNKDRNVLVNYGKIEIIIKSLYRLYMLQYDRVNVSEGIDVKKTS